MSIQQNSDYEVISFSEISSIINHFTPEMVGDIVDKAIASKTISYTPTVVNIATAFKAEYQRCKDQYPQYTAELNAEELGVFYTIIEKMCKAYNLIYTGNEGTDIISAAEWMYDFFICKFDSYIVEFISSYILAEKESFTAMLSGKEDKKEPSSYSKKMFKGQNSDLSLIHANLLYVVDQMCVFDFSIHDIVTRSYGPSAIRISAFINSVVSDSGEFYSRICVPFIIENKAQIITNVKFILQNRSALNITDLV